MSPLTLAHDYQCGWFFYMLIAEFDQYLDKPVLKPSVTLLQDWITS